MSKKKRKGTKSSGKKRTKDNIELYKNKILQFLNNNSGKAFTEKQIARKAGASNKKARAMVVHALIDLELDEKIRETGKGFYTSIYEGELLKGKVDFVNPRFGFIVVEGEDHDIKVASRDMGQALDGDEVEVQIFKEAMDGRNPEGRVVQIIKRSRMEFVGRLDLGDRFAFVIPDNKRMHTDIFVHKGKLKGAKNNDKVIVRITSWPEDEKSPIGEVVKILGKAGDNTAEMHSIMAEFGLPFEFEEKIVEAAERIPGEITNDEIKKRRDFRDVTTFTIDPVDAKDFDDALSFVDLGDGMYEIGVHIADVSHYVTPDSVLDKEAFARATSVYLVDRTIPMLPERLSNDLCSLRPNEDRLTFSATFKMDDNGTVKDAWFGRGVIHSDRRFSYEEAQELIEGQEGDFADEIRLLNSIAKKLKAKRYTKGAINFETVEVKFKLDENGKPLGVIPKVRKDAHKMIEEFMLLANKSVAEKVYHKKKGKEKLTFVYRVHDNPDPDRLETFGKFAARFGHKVDLNSENIAKALNTLMDEIEGKPEQNILESLAIRTMAKAIYTTEERGHFGLAFDHYTHFTSPIRRYPDVMVHRLLQRYLDDNETAEKGLFENKCRHSSEMERRATEAERASIKYKQVEYMSDHVGEEFNGIVSGVTDWGVYIEITDTACEGMIRVADLDDDYYEFDEKNMRLIGQRNKRIITLGDNMKVRVVRTDLDKRNIDLELVYND
ncbi:ribonuclease R [Marinigracilibium pacificum]|uniref:Ribonuclease R n=1 Tax=Marinigracilibium pacificum TaxID=2729599 RepID=A0A848IYZ9_9BACT|nr:ribonuclease R [Marinigracilibium pacificum]NMM49753.1 ribonuclease R [Marinigracilibium pacificum]